MMARVLAALLLAPPFLLVLYYGSWPLAILFSFLSLLASIEFLKMEEGESHRSRTLLTVIWALAFPLVHCQWGLRGGALLLVGFMPLLVIPALLKGKPQGEGRALAHSLLCVVLCGFALGFVVLIREHLVKGRELIIVLIAIVWMQDTAAYFIGTAIGRHKLTSLSPKKSWEGSIFGLIFGVLAGLLLSHFLGVIEGISFVYVIVLGFTALAGQLGDLMESLLKRDYGIKDSGHLIPGHGGILDRFDSVCSAAPVLYVWLEVLPLPK